MQVAVCISDNVTFELHSVDVSRKSLVWCGSDTKILWICVIFVSDPPQTRDFLDTSVCSLETVMLLERSRCFVVEIDWTLASICQ